MTPTALFTLTGNLLAERTLEFSAWSEGQTQRAQRESFQVGGKGINVAKMLQRLGASATAVCFAGGASGTESTAWLRAQKFSTQIFPTAAATRVGLVVRGGGRAETTFLGPDVPPDARAVQACADYLDAQPAGQVLAVCGSLPGWTSSAFNPLRAALVRWQTRGTLAADTYGPPLAWMAAQPLALIKINATELRTLAPATTAPQATADLLLPIAAGSAVRRWVVTDGAGPIWFKDGAASPASVRPIPVQEVSPTGSGDVLLACLMESLFLRGSPLADSIAQALPYAAANAAHAGVADFPLPR
jgi:fructose-1-phosphate kinase PfkB-like protein